MSTATSFWYQAGLNAVGPFVTAIVGSLLIGILVQAITRGAQERRAARELRNRPERRERTASWRTGIENQATRVQIAVDEIRSANRVLYERDGESDAAVKAHSNEPVLQCIENDVELALEISRSGAPRGVLGRLRDLWTGSSFEQALAAINRARETLLLVQPGPAVLARLPDLRAGVKDHLRVTNPRFDVFMRIIDAAERRAGLLSTEAKGDQKNRA